MPLYAIGICFGAALENARTYMNVMYLVQKDIVSNIVILKM